ncbi:MAG: SAM-dependent DNA methyltransferase, partial [Bacillota bacterium]
MPVLPTDLRNKLECTVVKARDVAEAGAKAALEALAVHDSKYYDHLSPEGRRLRNHLRARARQLGDKQRKGGSLEINRLVRECAYEHWHRMLFARFLAENDLLIEPVTGVAVSLKECGELAKDENTDLWTLAGRFAQRMLPRIFRPDDPVLQVTFAREHQLKLENLLNDLESAVFTTSDALGWVYQFWQSKCKKEVNDAGNKIGAEELPAVTQLFTEPYMVNFLIHNTLGAWHAGRVLAENPRLAEQARSEEEVRRAVALPGVTWDYLRFIRSDGGRGPWRPAAGVFEGWPKRAAELKVLDPCCGSGHFLVAALHHLVPLRMAEEGIS